MLKELLKKQGLDDTKVEAILNAMKEAKVYVSKSENIDERYSKLKSQKAELDKQLTERDTQLEELKKNNSSNAKLLKQLEDLKSTNETSKTEYENKISQMEFNYKLDNSLLEAKCKNPKALKAILNLANIKLKDDNFEGLKDQLESLKKSDGYLFEETPGTNTGSVGSFGSTTNGSTSTSDFISAITNNSLRK